MSTLSLKDLSAAVLLECTAKNLAVAKTRLVKLLYLVELEYFRENKKRLTETQWRFWHYGPYSQEIEVVLKDPLFEVVKGTMTNDFDYQGVRLRSTELQLKLDWSIARPIKILVSKWGKAPLEELLDFVYFDTEPMSTAKRGEVLSFEGVSPFERTVIPDGSTASKDGKKKLKSLQEEITALLTTMKTESLYRSDGTYEKGVKLWDDIPAPPTQGEAFSEQ